MLTPFPWNLILYPGLKFDPLFRFFTDDAHTQPFPLTGYSAQLNIGNGLLVLTSGSGLTLSAGTVQAFAGAAVTARVSTGTYPWFLEWTPPAGEPDCPIAGDVLVRTP